METYSQRLLVRVRRHLTFGSAGSALLATVLLCTCIVGRVEAAAHASAGVNRTVPKVSPPTVLTFSSPPTDAEFLRTGLFAEPLAPVAVTTPEENRDLAKAVFAYRDAVRAAGATDAVEPLLAFLMAHPASPWKPALQLNLGMIYRQTGHFSQALAVWQAGWSDAEVLSDPHGRALANAMVARLSQLEAYLGRKELLKPLLESIHSRPIGGTAAQLITDSHTGLYDMVYHPDESFRCGPLALTRILKYGNAKPSPQALRVLEDAHSTPDGLSLTAVQQISAEAGMNYQTAYRTPGAAMIMPAVVHWKVGHYAAIVDRNNGRYVVQDTTFGDDIRVSPATLDEESSGYFLVPRGALPEGWRPVSAAEGAKVWGRGDTGKKVDQTATGPKSPTNTCPDNAPCTTSSVELAVVGLQLHDTPVGYTPPIGPPVRIALYYSHRDALQPTTFSYTNFGPKWTFTWLSYVTDNVTDYLGQATVYERGGGSEPFSYSQLTYVCNAPGCPPPPVTTSYPGPYSHAILTRNTTSGGYGTTGFTLAYPDGSIEQFDQPSGSLFFLTAVSDPAGNTATLTYDSQMRVVAITDAIGQVTTLSYGLPSSPLLVTQITDPFGRSASFTYNASGQLASITDILGITSSYTYGQGTDPDFINTLTTPYGSTTFTFGDSNTNSSLGSTRFVKTVDPLNRTSYVEYDQGVDAGDTSGGVMINPNLVPSGMNTCNQALFYQNTFVFDANQYQQASQGGGLNYGLGWVIHWAHSSDEVSSSRFKVSEKQPLENRVWYNYPEQGSACGSEISTVSSTGVATSGASNLPTVIGRVLDGGATQLQTFQYNPLGNVTFAQDPAGRQLTYVYATNNIDLLRTSNTTSGTTQLLETRTYNSQHLPLSITGANGKTAHILYNSDGQPTRYTDQLGHATALTYDGNGHLTTLTGPITSAKYSFAYDNVSRVVSATDPAGSTVRFTYDAADRPTGATYPDGTSSALTYTLLDLSSSTDRLHQTTHYQYDADRELISTTDPLGHTIQQGYNPAGVLASITDANNHSTILTLDDQSRVTTKSYASGASVNIVYENGLSLVSLITDALGQITSYTYNPDNTTATIGYSSNQPTAAVSFSYDPAYPRLLSMTDGIGTTSNSYYPVSTPAGLGANQLKSVTSPVAGTSGSDIVTYSYDAMNRVVGSTLNGTPQSIAFDALGRITSASNALDTFTYRYTDGTQRVSGVSSSSGPAAGMTYFGPTGDELLQQMNVTTNGGGTSLSQFAYTYNADDIVKSFAVSAPSAQTTAYAYDTANRLISGLFSGSTPQYAYSYDPASNLISITPNGPQQTFSYTSTNTMTAGTYDSNGSLTAIAGNAYTWDGANRIVAFSNSASQTSSSFTYDGLGRLVRVVDSNSGTVIADHSYIWCGAVRCLAHDNTQSGSPVSTQYFAQGVITNGTPFYYVQDRLGSVTQLVSNSGSIAAQYSYDPYGNQTTVSGSVVSDIGYAGYFSHAASGLDFTVYRAYDPSHARWLSRDPIGEAGGINLYAYTDGDPISQYDPLGLQAIPPNCMAHIIHAHGFNSPRTKQRNSRFTPEYSTPEALQALSNQVFAAPGSPPVPFYGGLVQISGEVNLRDNDTGETIPYIIGTDADGIPTNTVLIRYDPQTGNVASMFPVPMYSLPVPMQRP